MSKRRLINDGPCIAVLSSAEEAREEGRRALDNPQDARDEADGYIVHEDTRDDGEPLFHIYLAKWL